MDTNYYHYFYQSLGVQDLVHLAHWVDAAAVAFDGVGCDYSEPCWHSGSLAPPVERGVAGSGGGVGADLLRPLRRPLPQSRRAIAAGRAAVVAAAAALAVAAGVAVVARRRRRRQLAPRIVGESHDSIS